MNQERIERFRQMTIERNKARAKYTNANKRLLNIWRWMKARCYCKSNRNYPNYGKRGIKMCDAWLDDYFAFESWALSHGYMETLSIDRIDVNDNYCPENCRWADAKTQANNKRTTKYLTYNGETKTYTQWASELNIPCSVMYDRTHKGWSPFEILYGKSFKGGVRYIKCDGEIRPLAEWARITNQPYNRLASRCRRNWSDEEIIHGKQTK